MLRLLSVVVIFLCTQCGSCATNVSADDYPSEIHHVVTDDGYILELRRIPYGRGLGSESRKVVFIMHGLFGGYSLFTFLGPEYGMAYNLVDAGYDVWMGNARGNKFSRRHVSLDPDKDKYKFFNFTFEEMATLDLPAAFDYILNITKQNQLHYIGLSMGGTMFLVMNSMTSKYHSKISSAHLLAGIGYEDNFPNAALKVLAYNTETFYKSLLLTGNVEIRLPQNKVFKVLTTAVEKIFDLPDELFAGTSTKAVVHFGQNIKDKRFRRYNYGDGNLQKYGTTSPPLYNLTAIDVNVTFHYSLSDSVLSETDALAMVRAMPKAKARKVPDDSFTHIDYVFKKSAKKLVTDYIIESFDNY